VTHTGNQVELLPVNGATLASDARVLETARALGTRVGGEERTLSAVGPFKSALPHLGITRTTHGAAGRSRDLTTVCFWGHGGEWHTRPRMWRWLRRPGPGGSG
jgi:hypothetical protein